MQSHHRRVGFLLGVKPCGCVSQIRLLNDVVALEDRRGSMAADLHGHSFTHSQAFAGCALRFAADRDTAIRRISIDGGFHICIVPSSPVRVRTFGKRTSRVPLARLRLAMHRGSRAVLPLSRVSTWSSGFLRTQQACSNVKHSSVSETSRPRPFFVEPTSSLTVRSAKSTCRTRSPRTSLSRHPKVQPMANAVCNHSPFTPHSRASFA